MAVLRWAVPAVLLALESLALSWALDLPLGGPAMPIVDAVRVAFYVVLGAGAAGYLLARHHVRDPAPGADLVSEWRPWPGLAAHAGMAAVTGAFASRIMGGEDATPSAGAFAAWLACAGATALLALWSAAPIGWTLRHVMARWRVPALAIGLGVAAWRAAASSSALWAPFGAATLRSVGLVLRAVGAEPTVDPAMDIVRLGGFGVQIAPICSGLEGFGLTVAFLSTWILLARDRMRWPRALLLIPAGAAAVLVANVLRIAILVLLGAAGHTAVAVGGFHSKAGWVLFLLVSFGCIAVAERVRWFRSTAPGAREEATLPAVAAAYVSPLLAALLAALVTGMWTTGPADPMYSVRIAVGAAVLWSVRGALPRLAAPRLGVPILAGGAVAAIWIAWPAAGAEGVRAAIEGCLPLERWSWIAARVVGSCTIVPWIEELAFRGFLLPWVVSPEFDRTDPRRWTWSAVLLSSLAFGLLHGNVLLGTIAGGAFAAARLWRGRLADAVLAHAVANAVIAAAVLLAGRWDLWPQ